MNPRGSSFEEPQGSSALNGRSVGAWFCALGRTRVVYAGRDSRPRASFWIVNLNSKSGANRQTGSAKGGRISSWIDALGSRSPPFESVTVYRVSSHAGYFCGGQTRNSPLIGVAMKAGYPQAI